MADSRTVQPVMARRMLSLSVTSPSASVTSMGSWERAAAHCAERGWVLARIDSKKQSIEIQKVAQKQRKARWWIGFTDRRVEDDYRWVDHSPVTFAYWGKGEPDNYVCNQDCAALTEDDGGRWHDNHCGHRLPFVCREE